MRLIKPLAAAIAFNVCAVNVLAQDTALEQDYILEEVYVTATKKSESLQDIPVTVSAFSSDTIQDAGIQNATDVATMTPSLSVNVNVSPFSTRMSVRGVGTAQNDPALEPSVGLFVDGVYLGRSGLGMSDLADIERIEVLQGPQGTLYGKNTNAGAISIVTKGPNLDEYEGYIEASIGNYELKRFTASTSGPLSDSVAFRLSANAHQRDGFYDNQAGEDMNDADDWSLMGKLLWEPTDSLSFMLSASHVERDTNCCGAESVQDAAVNAELANQGLPQDANDPYDYKVSADEVSKFALESDMASLTVNYDEDWGSITSITAWNDHGYTSNVDPDRSQLDIMAMINDQFSGNSFSQELRLSSDIGDQIDYQVGLFYYEQTTEQGGAPHAFLGSDFNTIASQIISPMIVMAAQPGDSIKFDHTLETETVAVFGQATWHFADYWHLKGGLRWTAEEKKADLFAEAVSTSMAATFGAPTIVEQVSTPVDAKFNRDGENVDWLVSLSRDIGDSSMIFATAATGSKSGGFNTVSGGVADREFADETTMNYELGVKTTLLQSRLRLNATAFYSEIEDYQQQQQLPASAGTFVSNQGAVKTSGLDLFLEALPLPNLTVTAGLLYMHDYEVTKGVDKGLSLPFTSEYSANLSATFVHPLADGTAFVRTDYSYMDEQSTNVGHQHELRASDFNNRSLLNLTVGWRNESWNVSVWGKNVTEDKFASYTAVPFPFSNADIYFLAPPRTFGATVRYDF